MKKKQRNSTIEILRIVAMFMIVMGHFIGQTYAISNTAGINFLFCHILGYGGRIAVNIFLIIGTWFMCDLEFKADRIFKLYLQLWIFTFCFSIVAIFLGAEYSAIDIVKFIIPYSSSRLWFATSYISLMLISPFLKKILFRKELLKKILLILLFIVLIMYNVHSESDSYLDSLVWFTFIYLFVGYYKNYVFVVKKNNKAVLRVVIGSLLYIVITLVLFFTTVKDGTMYEINSLHKITLRIISDYKYVPNFICAWLISTGFFSLNNTYIPLVNKIADATFAVYIIHQVPLFYNVLWYKIIKCEIWYMSNLYPLYAIVTVVVIFVICFLARLSEKVIENLISQFAWYQKAKEKLEDFYTID